MPNLHDRAFSVSVVDSEGKFASGAIVRIYRDGQPKTEGVIRDGPFLTQVSAPTATLEVEILYPPYFHSRQEVRPDQGSFVVTVPAQRVSVQPSRRRRRLAWAIVGLIAIVVAVAIAVSIWLSGGDPPYVKAGYLDRGPHNKPVAVVFVHGIFGTKTDTWVNGGASFPTLLAADPEFRDRIDVFLYEYFTPKFGKASSIVSLADELRGSLDDHGVFENHQRVVFLSHSMGGLVVRQFLLTKRDRLAKVPMLYFYATPTYGSDLTVFANLISSNPQLRGMIPLEGNDLLQSIQSGWSGSAEANQIPSYCAYETLPVYGTLVVSRASATALCNRELDPISSNHLDIVKPRDRDDSRYTRFANAMRHSVPQPPAPPPDQPKDAPQTSFSNTFTFTPQKPFYIKFDKSTFKYAYGFSSLGLEPSMVGGGIKISKVRVSLDVVNKGQIAWCDVWVFLGPSFFPPPFTKNGGGQKGTDPGSIDPGTGLAPTQVKFVIGAPSGMSFPQGRSTLWASYDFSTEAKDAQPSFVTLKGAVNVPMSLRNGLYAQVLVWTGDYRSNLEIRSIGLDVEGTTPIR